MATHRRTNGESVPSSFSSLLCRLESRCYARRRTVVVPMIVVVIFQQSSLTRSPTNRYESARQRFIRTKSFPLLFVRRSPLNYPLLLYPFFSLYCLLACEWMTQSQGTRRELCITLIFPLTLWGTVLHHRLLYVASTTFVVDGCSFVRK